MGSPPEDRRATAGDHAGQWGRTNGPASPVGPVVAYADLVAGLRSLGLGCASRVVVHSSLSAFGWVEGGAATIVRALLDSGGTVVMPAFTYQCGAWSPEGDFPGNAYAPAPWPGYGPVPFSLDLPIHPDIGIIPETFRRDFGAVRSDHPVDSFVALGPDAAAVLASQSLDESLAPLAALRDRGGDVLLLGVDHTKNTAVHVAEQEAGRHTLVRHALTTSGIVTVRNSGGCSDGFSAIEPHVADITRELWIGTARVRRLPLRPLLARARALIAADPLALLCDDPECERCRAVEAIDGARRVAPGGPGAGGCDA
jgi:aminoglycoside 3-N-acetyltransferase